MTKQEIISKLDVCPTIIAKDSFPSQPDDSINGVNKYVFQIQETDLYDASSLNSRTLVVYVDDEGGENERAFTELKIINSPSLEVLEYLNNNFVKFEIADTQFNKNCVYTFKGTTSNENGSFVTKDYIVCETKDGISHGEIM